MTMKTSPRIKMCTIMTKTTSLRNHLLNNAKSTFSRKEARTRARITIRIPTTAVTTTFYMLTLMKHTSATVSIINFRSQSWNLYHTSSWTRLHATLSCRGFNSLTSVQDRCRKECRDNTVLQTCQSTVQTIWEPWARRASSRSAATTLSIRGVRCCRVTWLNQLSLIRSKLMTAGSW